MKDTAPKEVVSYKQITLQEDIFDSNLINEAAIEEFALEIQGEAIEIEDKYPLLVLMGIFGLIHRLCPEMVLRTKAGNRFLIFSHQHTPLIREANIIMLNEYKHSISSESETIDELTIDIEDIFKEAEGNDELQKIISAREDILKLIKPSEKVVFIGEAPSVLFLIIQHDLFRVTKNIFYKKNIEDMAIKIKEYETR